VSREEVPEADVVREREIFAAQAAQSGKPAQVIAKMVDGKIEKYFAEVCLLEQDYIKEPGKAVRQIIADAIGKLGENITVRRFARFSWERAATRARAMTGSPRRSDEGRQRQLPRPPRSPRGLAAPLPTRPPEDQRRSARG